MTTKTRANDTMQKIADRTGMTKLKLSSQWWGNEKFGEWTQNVWGLIDHETDDAIHLAVATLGNDLKTVRHFDDYRDFTDVWLPKAEAKRVVEPDMLRFTADEDEGTVYAVLQTGSRYGPKICLWGDTYEALSDDGAAALDDHWNTHHASYNGECWTVDQIDGVVIRKLTEAGFNFEFAEEYADD